MHDRKTLYFLAEVFLFAAVTSGSGAPTSSKTISSNATGKQGNYYYEYWKDNGTGTMTLGDSCNFTCQWGSVGNILFRKGIRPGSKKQVVIYSADYKPTGNSYLSIYGWFKSPLVEYYIIESWGTWKPPGGTSKATVTTDSGTYDIYQNQRTGPSIEGNKTFTQYWSVRKVKRTSGVITCGNHFAAWEKAGMTIGTFYEVSFNVEAYQSGGGSADVKAFMDTVAPVPSGILGGDRPGAFAAGAGESGRRHIMVSQGGAPSFTLSTQAGGYANVRVYDFFGREIADLGKRELSGGRQTIRFDGPRIASGAYYYAIRKYD
jgi:endo-1,4-beta-xylanase